MANPLDGRIGGRAEFGVASSGVRGRIARSRQAIPLTERILRRLPGPRRLWVAAWVLVPWVNLAVILWLGADVECCGGHHRSHHLGHCWVVSN
jgi:hypothetical protein